MQEETARVHRDKSKDARKGIGADVSPLDETIVVTPENGKPIARLMKAVPETPSRAVTHAPTIVLTPERVSELAPKRPRARWKLWKELRPESEVVAHGPFPEIKNRPYTIDQKLGEGGMGAVYRAKELKTLQGKKTEIRDVVIKVIKKEFLAKQHTLKRFARELKAQVEAGANPYNVQTFDLVETDQGIGIVMEYLDDGDLGNLLEQFEQAPSEEFVCAVARQICLALHELHKKGLVHRDLKPGNVLIEREPNFFLKLADYGVAGAMESAISRSGKAAEMTERPTGGEDLSKTSLFQTSSGGFVGTPMYLSPEAFATGKTDARADLYSLGVMMYEMLSGGVLPFTRAASIPELMIKKLHSEPIPIHERLEKSSPSELDLIVTQLLKRNPDERSALTFPDGRSISLATAVDVEKALGDYGERQGFLPTISIKPDVPVKGSKEQMIVEEFQGSDAKVPETPEAEKRKAA